MSGSKRLEHVNNVGSMATTSPQFLVSPAQRVNNFSPSAEKTPTSRHVTTRCDVESAGNHVQPLEYDNELTEIGPTNGKISPNQHASHAPNTQERLPMTRTIKSIAPQKFTKLVSQEPYPMNRGYVWQDLVASSNGNQPNTPHYPRTRTSFRDLKQSSQPVMSNGLNQGPTYIRKQVITSPSQNGSSWNNHGDCDNTPSNSERSRLDYKLYELQKELRARDLQLLQLRKVMEQNEIAMIQVSEERLQNWITRVTELKKQFNVRLKTERQLHIDENRLLRRALLKLTNDIRKLESKVNTLQFEKEVCDRNYTNIQKELVRTKSMVDDLVKKLAQTESKLTQVKSQLDDREVGPPRELCAAQPVTDPLTNGSTNARKCYVRSYSDVQIPHHSTPISQEQSLAGKPKTVRVQFKQTRFSGSPERSDDSSEFESEDSEVKSYQLSSGEQHQQLETSTSNTQSNKTTSSLTRHLSHIELASRRRHQFQSVNNVSSNCQSSENVSSYFASADNLSSEKNEWLLNKEVIFLRAELKKCHAMFQEERNQWTSEKNKVIAYQQTIQTAYLTMEEKSRTLEDRVQTLTKQLEYEKSKHQYNL